MNYDCPLPSAESFLFREYTCIQHIHGFIPEALEEQLLADITKGQSDEGLSPLQYGRGRSYYM